MRHILATNKLATGTGGVIVYQSSMMVTNVRSAKNLVRLLPGYIEGHFTVL